MAQKIGRNTLADGAIGRFYVRGANGYSQRKLDDQKFSLDGRLRVFTGVVEWTYTLTLDKASVREDDYCDMSSAAGETRKAYDPALDTVVRIYWWAHTVNGKLVAGKAPLPQHMGAMWAPKEEINRLNALLGKQKGDDACPLPVWIKVRESQGYNNPVAFGDESLKMAGKRAAEMADSVEDDEPVTTTDADSVDDEPADDVPTVQRGEVEHDKPVDPQKEQSTRRRSRSS